MSKSNKEKMVVKPSKVKHKMDKEELDIHLHIQRKGGVSHKTKKDYKRRSEKKHRKRTRDYL